MANKRFFGYFCSNNKKKINMALTAEIKFGSNGSKSYDKEYLVSDYHIIHSRPYNKYCPEGSTRCERLEVSIICPGRDDLDLYKWYDTQNAQEGCIVISTTTVKASDGEAKHIVYFENARCFCLSEEYDIGTSRRRILKLAIEAEKISVDDVEIKRC